MLPNIYKADCEPNKTSEPGIDNNHQKHQQCDADHCVQEWFYCVHLRFSSIRAALRQLYAAAKIIREYSPQEARWAYGNGHLSVAA
jgi:hypothetical protein